MGRQLVGEYPFPEILPNTMHDSTTRTPTSRGITKRLFVRPLCVFRHSADRRVDGREEVKKNRNFGAIRGKSASRSRSSRENLCLCSSGVFFCFFRAPISGYQQIVTECRATRAYFLAIKNLKIKSQQPGNPQVPELFLRRLFFLWQRVSS